MVRSQSLNVAGVKKVDEGVIACEVDGNRDEVELRVKGRAVEAANPKHVMCCKLNPILNQVLLFTT